MTTTLRLAKDRGHFDFGWLSTYHTFSFGDYFDPRHMGFRTLRVINEDVVQPGEGFPTHPHRDMEIVTYVLEGALEHKDSMGNGSVIRPGDVQRMSAGTGVTHSEFNHSKVDPVHLLQIWILPERRGITPGYEQKTFLPEEQEGALRLIASPDGAAGSVTIHQDARIFATRLAAGARTAHEVVEGRHAWVHVATGRVNLDGQILGPGDAAGISGPAHLDLTGVEPSEVLVFDLN